MTIGLELTDLEKNEHCPETYFARLIYIYIQIYIDIYIYPNM